MRRIIVLGLVLLAGILLSASSAFAGDISGTIKYEGAIPKLKALKMDADPKCAAKHSTPQESEMLVLGDGNTMANIFVQISKGVPAKDYPVPSTPVDIHQDGCIYKPHVVGVMAGQNVKFHNADGTLHNVHALPKTNREFNLAMPASRLEAEKSFSKPEPMFPVKCDVHPWMGAFVSVMSHPYFDVTGKDGKYTISGLPDGTYEVSAWHEKLGTQTASVTITGGAAQTADFTFSRDKK